MAVKLPVNIGVCDSEIGAKIDDPSAGRQKWPGKFGSESMWQGEKNKTGLARDLFWVGIGKLERGRSFMMGKARKNLRERFAGQLPRPDILVNNRYPCRPPSPRLSPPAPPAASPDIAACPATNRCHIVR